MVPNAFRGLRVLRLANSVAVASALASLTGLSLELLLNGASSGPQFDLARALLSVPTFIVGLAWAAMFRMRRPSDRTKPHVAWLAAVPLAVVNAALSCALVYGFPRPDRRLEQIVTGAIAGATFGAIIWIPALLATIGLFGLPLWRAQKLAERGLAGEERGERTVGAVCALLGAFGAIGALVSLGTHMVPFVLGLLGLSLGSIAAGLAHAREQRRRSFVAEAEAGRIEGYRVDVVPEGKVLIRVVRGVDTYRHAEQHEALVAIDADGGVVHSAVADRG